jgi:hypothetical protein
MLIRTQVGVSLDAPPDRRVARRAPPAAVDPRADGLLRGRGSPTTVSMT